MPRRIPRRAVFSVLATLLFVGLFLSPVVAQPTNTVRILPQARFDESDIQRVIAAGAQLEQQRRWGEALTHYRDALRSYPGRRELEQRRSLARIHFDLARRYADRSYTAAVGTMDRREALDLYGEMLTAIHSYYVTAPEWRELIHRGISHLDVALTEEVFLERHLQGVSSARIEAFRKQMIASVDWEHLGTRHDAKDEVAKLAQRAADQLGIPPSAVILEFACGAAGALDTYSAFLTGSQLEDLFSQIEGNFVGLGIELKADNQSLLIVNAIPGSPAHRGGIRSGDRIVSVDGQSTREISTEKAADMLKGESGTRVALKVVSPTGQTREIELLRERVDVPSIEGAKILVSRFGIAYLRLTSFQKTTSRDLDAALWRLHREGMRSLIIDVRGNPGGLLTASVDAADKFVNSGSIVSTRGRSQRENYDYQAHTVGTWRVPLVVLIDRDTASASEIFAGAIGDHRRGAVIGEQSFGKGSVQGIFPLQKSKAGIRLTTAKFYSPSGQAISKRGVTPSIRVFTTAKPVSDGFTQTAPIEKTDPVLAAALQTARQAVAAK